MSWSTISLCGPPSCGLPSCRRPSCGRPSAVCRLQAARRPAVGRLQSAFCSQRSAVSRLQAVCLQSAVCRRHGRPAVGRLYSAVCRWHAVLRSDPCSLPSALCSLPFVVAACSPASAACRLQTVCLQSAVCRRHGRPAVGRLQVASRPAVGPLQSATAVLPFRFSVPGLDRPAVRSRHRSANK